MASDHIQSPTARKPLHFGYAYQPAGAHPGGWRRPDGNHDAFDPNQITTLARKAEEAGFDFIHFDDRVSGTVGPDTLIRTEPFTTGSFLATRTRKIGILASGNTSYHEPFNLGRLTASLDHVTHGRAGWHVTTGATRQSARNFSQGAVDAAEHYTRATEVVGIIRKLWDSWEDDAFIRNKLTGEYVDGKKIHPIHHAGRLFRIKGPLNVARPPQGQLIVSHEVTTEPAAIDLAARDADLVFINVDEPSAIRDLADELRHRAAQYGRGASRLTLLATLTPIVAASNEEALRIYDELYARVPESQIDIAALSGRFGVDLAPLRFENVIDAGLAARLSPAGLALLKVVEARTGRAVGADKPARIADLIHAALTPGQYLIGAPDTLAVRLAALASDERVDGFLVRSPYLPGQLHAFVDLLAPELRARGLLRRDYAGATLREHLGLEIPANRYQAA